NAVPNTFHMLHRERRKDRNYLRAVLGDTEDAKRWGFAKTICNHAAEALNAPPLQETRRSDCCPARTRERSAR
ncbi:hypothetical protein OAA76_06775, partial [Planktotalea frisia]|nr:hypothetical protein [Planktotalea frisia]